MHSTRSKDVEVGLIGKPKDQPFSPLKLPTKRAVLQRFLFYLKIQKKSRQDAVATTCNEIEFLWKKISAGSTPGYACFQTKKTIKLKLSKLWDEHRKIEAQASKPPTKHGNTRKEQFEADLDTLFDIAKANIKEKLNEEDYAFVKDQQGQRKSTFGCKDKALEKRLLRKRGAEEVELGRKNKSVKEMEVLNSVETGLDFLSSSDTDARSSSVSGEDWESTSNITAKPQSVSLEVPRQITKLPQVIAAADRHKISSNALNDVLAALIRECHGDVNDFVLSTSTTLRSRQVVRSTEVEKIKEDFKNTLKSEFFTIHWDEKLLTEGNDFQATEHIAILSSHGDAVKLLGTTKLESGSGLNQAMSIKNMLDDWDIEELCVAMCFDTTASNTGKFNGACILLEGFLDHPLLWTACRHHILEVVLSHIFKKIFGESSGPKVEVFEILKKKWPSLDLTRNTIHMPETESDRFQEDVWTAQMSLAKIRDEDSYIPRDDYAELLNLSLYYINKSAFPNFVFRRPGAQHRARWMSSAIYTLKMLLLQDQLDLDELVLSQLQQFGKFVAVFYSSYWFSAPFAHEAAVNDLQLFKKMQRYINTAGSPLQEIAITATVAMKHHLWYLTEELIPFALCSNQLSALEKEKIAYRLFSTYQRNREKTLTPQKPVFPQLSESTEICDLVGDRSVLLFQRLKFTMEDIQFLQYSSEKWLTFLSYQRLDKVVKNLKVVNDVAERGVKIMEDYKNILTQDSEQRNLILQCVETARRLLPDFRKSTLTGQSSSLSIQMQ